MSCSESNDDYELVVKKYESAGMKLSVFNWSGTPPLVVDEIEPCPQCEDPAGIIVHRAPFRFSVPYGKMVVIDSGSSLTGREIRQAEAYQRGFVHDLYRKTLEEMQATGGDSAYFTGEIIFKLKINSKGKVASAQILYSNTNMGSNAKVRGF